MEKQSSKRSESGKPLVSVVVVTRNRSFSLKDTLKALRSLKYGNFELLVVDNGSSDDTADVSLSFKARRFHAPSSKGIGYCRQLGLKESKGEIVAFCDDDCIPGAEWLDHLVRLFQAEKEVVITAGGVVNIGFKNSKQNKGLNKLGKNARALLVDDPGEADFFGNMNLAMRREEALALGGYDPFLNVMSDGDLQLRAREAGYGVAYEPKAVVEHHNRGVFQKKRHLVFGLGASRLYIFFKHFKPVDVRGWMDFVWNETALFLQDGKREVRSLIGGMRARKAGSLAAGVRKMFNIVSARAVIPWLLYRAGRRKKWERESLAAAAGGRDRR